jgi:ADP-ribosylglycohydrolase
MYGAILGDIVRSPYAFDIGNKSKAFPLFSKNSTFTDDTVTTIAVAGALLTIRREKKVIHTRLIDTEEYLRMQAMAGCTIIGRKVKARNPTAATETAAQ